MLQEATVKAENFEKIAEDVFGAHKEMAHLVVMTSRLSS